MEVSVIIPTYNEEKYLRHCINSLRNQDYRGEYEIIVADSQSKDNTIKIAKRLADKVVVIAKRGAAAGRNAGAKVASGNVLLFIDADTLAMPNLLSEFVKRLRRKDTVGVTCNFLPFTTEFAYHFLYSFANMFVRLNIATGSPQVPGICCAYRKEAFEKVGGFNENLITNEDLDLSQRISKYGKIVLAKKTFVITSVRRLKRWGKRKAIRKYIGNYLKYVLFGKVTPAKDYRAVRCL